MQEPELDTDTELEVGIGVLLGLLFTVFGFLGSFAATFLWWLISKTSTKNETLMFGLFVLCVFTLTLIVLLHFVSKRVSYLLRKRRKM